MKTTSLIVLLFLTSRLICYSQSVQLYYDYCLSSELRIQSSNGFGLQFDKKMNDRNTIGLGFLYSLKGQKNYKNGVISTVDPEIFYDFKSSSKYYMFKLNLQHMFFEKNNILLAICPEISYLHFYSKDEIYMYLYYSYFVIKEMQLNSDRLGIGIKGQFEKKNFLIKNVSLLFKIGSNIMVGKKKSPTVQSYLVYKDNPNKSLICMHNFQIGLKYQIK